MSERPKARGEGGFSGLPARLAIVISGWLARGANASSPQDRPGDHAEERHKIKRDQAEVPANIRQAAGITLAGNIQFGAPKNEGRDPARGGQSALVSFPFLGPLLANEGAQPEPFKDKRQYPSRDPDTKKMMLTVKMSSDVILLARLSAALGQPAHA